MVGILIFIFGVVVGIVGVWIWIKWGKTGSGNMNIKKKSLIEVQAEKKVEYIRRILVFLAERKRVSNNDIEKLLGVSDAKVRRYLEELEQEGKVRQVGKIGEGVYYESIG